VGAEQHLAKQHRPSTRESYGVAVERAYFEKTGIFPIMHMIGVRSTLIQANPWLANAVIDDFARAKAVAMEEMSDVTALRATLPSLGARTSMKPASWDSSVPGMRRAICRPGRYSDLLGSVSAGGVPEAPSEAPAPRYG
jgi:hypothetical protein